MIAPRNAIKHCYSGYIEELNYRQAHNIYWRTTVYTIVSRGSLLILRDKGDKCQQF